MPLRNSGRPSVALEDAKRLPKVAALEIDEDIGFQRVGWTVQRVGWGVMSVVLVLAATGLLGGYGPLNQAIVRADGVAVEYERVVRHSGEARLAVEVPAALQRDGSFRLWFDRGWWQSMELETAPLPEAESSAVSGDRVLYEFASADPTVPVRVEFTLKPDGLGPREAGVGVVDGPSLSFNQLVLP